VSLALHVTRGLAPFGSTFCLALSVMAYTAVSDNVQAV